jgi:hypothetical protein
MGMPNQRYPHDHTGVLVRLQHGQELILKATGPDGKYRLAWCIFHLQAVEDWEDEIDGHLAIGSGIEEVCHLPGLPAKRFLLRFRHAIVAAQRETAAASPSFTIRSKGRYSSGLMHRQGSLSGRVFRGSHGSGQGSLKPRLLNLLCHTISPVSGLKQTTRTPPSALGCSPAAT